MPLTNLINFQALFEINLTLVPKSKRLIDLSIHKKKLTSIPKNMRVPD
jgi:hypothetical protein